MKIIQEYNCTKCGSHSTYQKEKAQHTGLYCAKCNSWITWIPKNLGNYELGFGKYKGKALKDIKLSELENYCLFFKGKELSKTMKKSINKVSAWIRLSKTEVIL